MADLFADIIKDHQHTIESLVGVRQQVDVLISHISRCLYKGNRVFTCGNGGSAAEAQHLASELVGRFGKNNRPLSIMSLCTDPSTVTALANDFEFSEVFARQIEAHGRPGDLLVVFSTSGESANCVLAARLAIALDMECCALTGEKESSLSEVVSATVHVPSDNTQRVQEAHHLITHLVWSFLEELWPPT